MNRVILQFNSFEDRDRWLSAMHDHILRVYRRNPWIAAELSDDEISQLKQQSEVEIFPDTQMRPFSASI